MRTRLGILAASASLIAGMSGAAIADPGDAPLPGTSASLTGQSAMAQQAKDALAKVESIFGGDTRSKRAAHAHGRSATLALRDLALSKGALTGADRAAADRFLARPTDGVLDEFDDGYDVAEATPECGDYVCIHYVTSTEDAPPAATAAGDPALNDYVEFARDTLDGVHETYVAAGYRAPKSDVGSANNGGDAKTDIYLAQIGDDGLYGYCTTDDPSVLGDKGNNLDVSAYCVLDNDYTEFDNITEAEALQVTAAHEYFHAVQYAYDIAEDGWFMEASATWAEDELFDGVNDNVGYLGAGQMGRPWYPLDYFGESAHYGNWIFLRYLTEKYAGETGVMPKIMRELWERVDASARTTIGGVYAIGAIKAELAQRNTSFTAQYSLFADAIRRRSSFEEGNGQKYPIKPLAAKVQRLSTTKKSTGWWSIPLFHLTSSTMRMEPTDTLKAKAWRLRVELNMTPTRRGSAAVVTVYKKGGGVSVQRVSLNSEGNKKVVVKFGKSEVKAVEVTWVNASTRFNCWVDGNSPISCYGSAKDDNQEQFMRATAFKK